MSREKWKKLEVGASSIVDKMDLRLHEAELEILCKTSQLIDQSLSLERKLQIVLQALFSHMSLKRCSIVLKRERGHFVSIVAPNGLRLEEKESGGYGLYEGAIERIIRTAQTFVAPDISKEPLFHNSAGWRKMQNGRISFIGVPIILHGACVGVLSLERLFDEDVPFEGDVRFLAILAALLAMLVSLNYAPKSRDQNDKGKDMPPTTGPSVNGKLFFSVGSSRSMSWANELIKKVAPTQASVLLLGESGTGKTLIARVIHDLSDRVWLPFVEVNCAAFPSDLLESELFGHESVALTGPPESRSGRFEAADRGTIFLDEIGEVPIKTQLKLLRFLQDCELERMRSRKTKTVDVRIIASSSKDLSKAVADGSFREDLYHRLNVFPIRIPSLQERREDIGPLINFFAEKIDCEYKRSFKLTDAALGALSNYSWPGNIRELKNLVERLAIMFSGETIDIGDLLPYISGPGEELETKLWQGKGSLREREKRDVVTALAKNRWILVRAAQELGITQRQMGCRVKKFGLKDVVRKQKLRAVTAAQN